MKMAQAEITKSLRAGAVARVRAWSGVQPGHASERGEQEAAHHSREKVFLCLAWLDCIEQTRSRLTLAWCKITDAGLFGARAMALLASRSLNIPASQEQLYINKLSSEWSSLPSAPQLREEATLFELNALPLSCCLLVNDLRELSDGIILAKMLKAASRTLAQQASAKLLLSSQLSAVERQRGVLTGLHSVLSKPASLAGLCTPGAAEAMARGDRRVLAAIARVFCVAIGEHGGGGSSVTDSLSDDAEAAVDDNDNTPPNVVAPPPSEAAAVKWVISHGRPTSKCPADVWATRHKDAL